MQVANKKVKLDLSKRQYINRRTSKKIIIPSHRATPVIPKIMQQANMNHRKRKHNDSPKNKFINKSLPDSTRRNTNQNGVGLQNVTIDVRELMNMKNSFRMLFKMLEDLKRPASRMMNRSCNEIIQAGLKTQDMTHTPYNQSLEEEEEKEENSENEEFNRSDDNVLITNKFNHVEEITAQSKGKDDEWVYYFKYFFMNRDFL